MSLYQEIPKESIMTLLREQFTAEELDAVRLDIQELLLCCNGMDEFRNKVYERIKSKQNLREFRIAQESNLFSS